MKFTEFIQYLKKTPRLIRWNAKYLLVLVLGFIIGCVGGYFFAINHLNWKFAVLESRIQRAENLGNYKEYEDSYMALSPEPAFGKVELSKLIDGVFYSVEGDEKAMNKYDYTHSLRFRADGEPLPVEQQELGRFLISTLNDSTRDFWIDFDKNRIFLLQSRLDFDSMPGSQMIEMHEFGEITDSSDNSLSVLKNLEIGLFEGYRILLFDSNRDTLVLEKSGGDGCGGAGTIQTLTLKGEMTDIFSFGSGCNWSEQYSHRFGGVLDNQLVVADAVRADENAIISDLGADLQNLYLLDPFTLEKTTLIEDPRLLRGLDLWDTVIARKRGTVDDQRSIVFEGYTKDELENVGLDGYVQGSTGAIFYNPETKSFRKVAW